MSKKKQPEQAETEQTEAKQASEEKTEQPAEAKTPAADWEAKYNDLNDRYLRMAAEYDNFRKRSQREREQAYTDAVSRAVTALLPTYDNLERALKAETADTEYKKGVEMTMTQLVESLKGINVAIIDAAAGTAFDPNFHNAVMHVEDESLGENVIAETFQQGFQNHTLRVLGNALFRGFHVAAVLTEPHAGNGAVFPVPGKSVQLVNQNGFP